MAQLSDYEFIKGKFANSNVIINHKDKIIFDSSNALKEYDGDLSGYIIAQTHAHIDHIHYPNMSGHKVIGDEWKLKNPKKYINGSLKSKHGLSKNYLLRFGGWVYSKVINFMHKSHINNLDTKIELEQSEDGLHYYIPGTKIQVIKHGGHTDDSTSFYDPECELVITGDAVHEDSKYLSSKNNEFKLSKAILGVYTIKRLGAKSMDPGHADKLEDGKQKIKKICNRVIANTIDDVDLIIALCSRTQGVSVREAQKGIKKYRKITNDYDRWDFNKKAYPEGILNELIDSGECRVEGKRVYVNEIDPERFKVYKSYLN